MKKLLLIFLLFFSIIILSGCASQPEPSYGPGFFMGIWHGICVPFSLIGSIFMDIRIYEFPNTGGRYDFGFFIGLLMLGLGGRGAANQ